MRKSDYMTGCSLLLTPMPASLEEAATRLIDAANEAGGKDNVSVVLVRFTE